MSGYCKSGYTPHFLDPLLTDVLLRLLFTHQRWIESQSVSSYEQSSILGQSQESQQSLLLVLSSQL